MYDRIYTSTVVQPGWHIKINHHTMRDAIIQENSLPSFSAFSTIFFLRLLKPVEQGMSETGHIAMVGMADVGH